MWNAVARSMRVCQVRALKHLFANAFVNAYECVFQVNQTHLGNKVEYHKLRAFCLRLNIKCLRAPSPMFAASKLDRRSGHTKVPRREISNKHCRSRCVFLSTCTNYTRGNVVLQQVMQQDSTEAYKIVRSIIFAISSSISTCYIRRCSSRYFGSTLTLQVPAPQHSRDDWLPWGSGMFETIDRSVVQWWRLEIDKRWLSSYCTLFWYFRVSYTF